MIILAYLLLCTLVGILGHRHRWLGFWGVFAVSLMFTPLVGLLLVILTHGGYRTNEMTD